MAITYSVNNLPATGSVAMQNLVSAALASGYWEGHAWGGGTSGHARSTDFTAGADGILNSATTITRAKSWFILKKVGSTRSVLFWKSNDTNKTTWYRGYAEGGFSNDGSTNTPDSESVVGDRQDIFGVYNTTWPQLLPTDNTYRWNIVCDGAAGWLWAEAHVKTTTNLRTFLVMEDVVGTVTGDTVPFVTMTDYEATGSLCDYSRVSSSTACGFTWIDYDESGLLPGVTPPKVWAYACAAYHTSASFGVVHRVMPTSVDGSQLEGIAYDCWSMAVAAMGRKGKSQVLKWAMNATANLTVLDDVTTPGLSWVCLNYLWLPWPNGVALSV